MAAKISLASSMRFIFTSLGERGISYLLCDGWVLYLALLTIAEILAG